MSVLELKRTERQEFVIQLRELARQIEDGACAYCLTYSMDKLGHVEELTFDKTTGSRHLSA